MSLHRHRDRHRRRRDRDAGYDADASGVKKPRQKKLERFLNAQATRMNADAGISGVTRDEVLDSMRRGPEIPAFVASNRIVDTRAERIREVDVSTAQNVVDLGIPTS